MTKGIVHKNPLRSGMGFAEAVERFIQTSARKLKVKKTTKRPKQK